MAKKRTKADQLQRSIQRAEKRMGTRAEESLTEPEPGKVAVIRGSARSGKEKEERDSGEAA